MHYPHKISKQESSQDRLPRRCATHSGRNLINRKRRAGRRVQVV